MRDTVILLAIMALVCGCTSQQADTSQGGQTTTTTTTTTTTILVFDVKDCVLSLCDCKCHPKGTTKEETEGVLCGINCFRQYEVTDCKLVDNTCTEVYAGEEEENVGIANPASEKCVADGGEVKILKEEGGERGICLFPDGSVCDEWAYFRGECSREKCMKKCDAVGTRSEGWYDCNGKLLYWDNCAG